MKIYHVETQGDYDALMIELEEKGCEWRCVEKPTKLDKFKIYGKDTYIYEEYGIISLSDGYYSKVYRNNETLIEYKAKGEDMTQEEMKHNLQEVAFDISESIESFARGTLAVEADLQEAKSSAKKLIEKIDEYLESQKPKFKVGDYAVELGKYITKIEKIDEGMPKGCFYMPGNNHFSPIKDSVSSYLARYATPEEIAEYEVALNFHKHGRKPFEIKEGDIISYNESDKFIVDYEDIEPEFETFDKENFIREDLTFLKTVEEVNEWLEK